MLEEEEEAKKFEDKVKLEVIPILDLTEIMLNYSGGEPPTRDFIINGKKVTFLCDSGADKTVVRERIPGLTPSNGKIYVKSANGQLSTNRISKPVVIVDCKNGWREKAPVVISPECPVNLMGRDLMTAFGISIVTIKGKMVAVSHRDEDVDEKWGQSGGEVYVTQGTAEPQYYYTYDLPSNDPHKTSEQLLSIVQTSLNNKQDVQNPDELHVTMKFKVSPGPDEDYEYRLQRLGPQKLQIQHVYSSERCSAFATVKLTERAREFYSVFGSRPHISLAKDYSSEWEELGHTALQMTHIHDWEKKSGGWEFSPSTHYVRKYLGWVFTGTPKTHLQERRTE